MLAKFSSASILCLTHMFGYFWLIFFFLKPLKLSKNQDTPYKPYFS